MEKPPKPSNPSPPDAHVWDEETRNVHPLGSKRGKHPTRNRMPKPALPQQAFIPPSQRHQPIPILSNTAECISGMAANQNPQRLKELSRAVPEPTAMLDLHGTREGDAWLKLHHWLSAAQTEDHRCVLVITGKGRGYGTQGNIGVLKAQIAVWLSAHPGVLGFHTAQPQHGGTGAVYVLLRRYQRG